MGALAMRRAWGLPIGASLVSALIIVPLSLWAVLALWFRLPAPEGSGVWPRACSLFSGLPLSWRCFPAEAWRR